jgi:hypothetical protein
MIMSKNDKKVITSLTKEQEALIPEYRERFRKIGLSTEPTDRVKAEAAIKRAYAYLSKSGECVAAPEIIWAESPMKGQVMAAQHAKGDMSVSIKEIQEQGSLASYGSFEAYWTSVYVYIKEVLPVDPDELVDIVYEIVQHCGVYWTFTDLVILTPKPSKIVMDGDKLHCTTGKALEYPNGDGFYAFRGEIKGSLMEVTLAERAYASGAGQETEKTDEAS